MCFERLFWFVGRELFIEGKRENSEISERGFFNNRLLMRDFEINLFYYDLFLKINIKYRMYIVRVSNVL